MNLINLFIHPKKYFTEINEKEKFSLLAPIVILVIIGVLTGLTAGNTVSSMGLPEEQMGSIQGLAIGFGIFSGIIGLAIALVLKTGIFHFVLKKMNGTASFKSAIYVVGISFFPKIFQGIINLLFQKPLDLNTIYEFNIVNFLAGIINIFNIWQIALTIIGLSIIYGVSYRKTAIPVIGFEVVAAGFTLVTTLITANSMAGITPTGIE
ncbi:Yip1 family protein [Acetobacterium bakii]|uniref:Yip1 domain-containing protein n=1 Tax=Acetobacterium bakii TaxID=52689 RepID=A0A0L6TZJ1_9FIRM|nr:Yip1 family protein [Acetobacterium bakii]KNZ40975.1 hypothetical protein AKG39_14825 [Acetobacterium bakii]